MSIAEFVRILGRGPGRSRSLTQEEAHEAMARVLCGDAAPESIGAMLMLMRMKGEVPEELAGFTAALREGLTEVPTPDLDWPSYAAGRTRGLPWFLLSARLVALAGYRVLMHGWNGLGESGHLVREGLPYAGITSCASPDEAGQVIASEGIAYLPLENFSPQLLRLLQLRADFGLRSCLNTVARMLNPGGARASVQGVFHPPYRELQADASKLLGLEAMSVIKGGGGEFERNPSKDIQVFGLRHGASWEGVEPPTLDDARRLNDGEIDLSRLSALWRGDLEDPFAEAIVIATAALALETLGVEQAEERARALWVTRSG
ncbi:glycosyl transferase family protein [Celeribacter neptunius]|uniref:Anthranilate phosphoribosyltransferase n=1 Tax=Celeribacter neptunius TaxID=588602 RepID=A0A1I3QYM0_9RHOB|nr:glycosyl transferase family protein [Celeribacter neptunius]SFJ38196.1 Anthranilate phosphoribosyltransferase [Celeribacter neptunius]